MSITRPPLRAGLRRYIARAADRCIAGEPRFSFEVLGHDAESARRAALAILRYGEALIGVEPLAPQYVAALFVRADSIYKSMPSVVAYDAALDARGFNGVTPVVAHPPCRAWARLRQFAQPRDDEKALGPFAVRWVQANGGVLEHPEGSTLWAHCGLPAPGAAPDAHGGFTLAIDQWQWGHRARKRTWLYIVPKVTVGFALPPMPERAGEPTHCVRPTKAYPRLPSITKAEREHTPEALAAWLVEVARRCVGHGTDFARQEVPHPGPVRWNLDPALTGDAHRLVKRERQQAHIARTQGAQA